MKSVLFLTLFVTRVCALPCTEGSCPDLDLDDGADAISLLQKAAKAVVSPAATEAKSVPKVEAAHAKSAPQLAHADKKEVPVKAAAKKEEPISALEAKAALAKPAAPANAQNAQNDGGVALPPVVHEFVKSWEWALTFNNTSLILGCIFCVIYELIIKFGGSKVKDHDGNEIGENPAQGLFDQEWAGKWQYYSYGFYQYAVFGVCVPLSEPLSTALGYNPAWSGLLMTIMPAMEVPGIEIGRRLVMPFHQDFLCKWLCFGRMWMAASEGMWVIVLMTPGMMNSPVMCFWLLMLSRALLGLGSGMVNTPTTYMAVKWTSKERMKNMTSYATMAKRLGMSFGVITSSFVLQVFNMNAKDSTIEQMAALPVAFSMVFGIALIIIFDISCTRGQPPDDTDNLKTVKKVLDEKKETLTVPTTVNSLKNRSSIVLNSIVYNFTGSMQRESIDLSSTMVFAGYGLSVVTIGYLIAAINFSAVVWIAFFTEFMKKGGWLDPAHLIVYYSYACAISGIFFFNFGTWWMFFIADCVCFCYTTAAIGISNGMATNAGIAGTHYSKDSFTAYRAQTTAGARFLSGPCARGAIYWTGRNGYGVMMAGFLAVSFYNNWMTRRCFLVKDPDDENDPNAVSEEQAQMNGVKRINEETVISSYYGVDFSKKDQKK